MTQNTLNQTLTAHEVPLVNGAGTQIGSIGLGDGEVLIGRTGDSPVAATLTAGSNVTITDSPNGITIAATGSGGFAVTQVKMTFITSATLYTFDPKMVAVRVDAVGAGGSVPGLRSTATNGSVTFSYNAFGCGADGGTFARVFATKPIGTAMQVTPGAANAAAVGSFKVPDNLGSLVSPPPSDLAINNVGGSTIVEFLGTGGVVATLTCPGGAGARLTSNKPVSVSGTNTTHATPSYRWPRSAMPTLNVVGSQPIKLVVSGASGQGQPGLQIGGPLGEGTRITGAGGGSYFSKGGARGFHGSGTNVALPATDVPYGAGNRAISRPSTTVADIGAQAPEGGAVLVYEYISD
jgi:hypothetical protein